MNDLKELAQLGTALDPPGRAPERLRSRVLAQTSRQRPVRRTRWLVITAGAAAVAVGVAVAIALIPGTEPTAQAAQVLHDAADRAQRQPTAAGNQFIYLESKVAELTQNESAPDQGRVVEKERRAWLSVDGTRDGLIREREAGGAWTDIPLPGCRDGERTETSGGRSKTGACTPTPGYRTDLPANADAMLARLRQSAGGVKNPADQQAFLTAADLLGAGGLSPAVTAAIFNAVATLPSATLVGDVVDGAGRAGVAVASPQPGDRRTELIFDRATFAYLGQRTVLERDQDGHKAGEVVGSSAELTVSVVNEVGRS